MTSARLLLVSVLFASLAISGPALAKKKGKKKKVEEAVEEPVQQGPKTKLPGDATSKSFGEKLLAAKIVDFEPPGDGGLPFIYETLVFKADNTWEAEAYLDAGDERMDCTESGTWTMDKAESDTVAPVNWVVEKTDCPAREKGKKARAQLSIQSDGDVTAEFR